MALSEQERRLLEQLEADLEAEDPRLASALRGGPRRHHRRRAVLAALGVIAGLALLVVGMEVHPLVSVLGFAIMLISTVFGISAWRPVEVDPNGARVDRRPGGGDDFMERLDERWRRGDDEVT
jgi:hypothetical protein